jgi:hypothetical protein
MSTTDRRCERCGKDREQLERLRSEKVVAFGRIDHDHVSGLWLCNGCWVKVDPDNPRSYRK